MKTTEKIDSQISTKSAQIGSVVLRTTRSSSVRPNPSMFKQESMRPKRTITKVGSAAKRIKQITTK
jgi:hypothetical protein